MTDKFSFSVAKFTNANLDMFVLRYPKVNTFLSVVPPSFSTVEEEIKLPKSSLGSVLVVDKEKPWRYGIIENVEALNPIYIGYKDDYVLEMILIGQPKFSMESLKFILLIINTSKDQQQMFSGGEVIDFRIDFENDSLNVRIETTSSSFLENIALKCPTKATLIFQNYRNSIFTFQINFAGSQCLVNNIMYTDNVTVSVSAGIDLGWEVIVTNEEEKEGENIVENIVQFVDSRTKSLGKSPGRSRDFNTIEFIYEEPKKKGTKYQHGGDKDDTDGQCVYCKLNFFYIFGLIFLVLTGAWYYQKKQRRRQGGDEMNIV